MQTVWPTGKNVAKIVIYPGIGEDAQRTLAGWSPLTKWLLGLLRCDPCWPQSFGRDERLLVTAKALRFTEVTLFDIKFKSDLYYN